MKSFLKVLMAVVIASSALAFTSAEPASAAASDCGSGYKYLGNGKTSKLEIRIYSNKAKKDWCAITYRKGTYKRYAGSTFAYLCSTASGNCNLGDGYGKSESDPAHSKAKCVTTLGAAYYRGSSGKKASVTTDKDKWCRKNMK